MPTPHDDEVSISVQMAVDKLSHEPDCDDPSFAHDSAERDEPERSWPLFADSTKWPLYSLRYYLREYFAEYFGTMILLIFGNGVVAATKFEAGTFNDYQSTAAYLSVTFGWGIGLTMALYCSMGVSGGHLNPAVTVANCVFGTCPWRKAPGFILAQLLGAMTGAGCVYGLFKDHFDDARKNLPPGVTETDELGGIFCTYPSVSNASAVWSEFLNTMLLMMGILGIVNDKLTPAVNHKPLAVGLLVFVIGVATGWNSGYAINPARDLGPRMVSAMIFKSSDPFTKQHHYFWIPMFIPFFGALAGFFLFTLFILPARD